MIKLIILFSAVISVAKQLENFNEELVISNMLVKSEKIVSLQESYRDYYPNKELEPARNFLQLYNSYNPIVVLVDENSGNFVNAANFMYNLFKLTANVENINFILMTFNATGVSSVLETTHNNKQHFENLLQNENGIQKVTSLLGDDEKFNKTAVFYAILNACYILPPNSGVLIFINRGIEDENLVQHALLEVKKKRIRVYVVWNGDYPSTSNKARLLEDLSKHSGGNFFVNTIKKGSLQNYQQFLENFNNYENISLILSEKKLNGEQNLEFPIDFDVTSVHISIFPNITSGTLITPRGTKINILDSNEISEYGSGSFTLQDTNTGLHEIHLNTTTVSTLDVGIWRLHLNNAGAFYDVLIFVHTNLITDAIVVSNNSTDSTEFPSSGKKVMKLGVFGDVGKISRISLVSRDGQVILDNVKFDLDKNWNNYLTENINNDVEVFDINNNNKKEVNIDIDQIPNGTFYAKINGKDSKGYEFTRLSYVNSYADNSIFQLPPLSIDVGYGSELIASPNTRPEIYFEVTNNGNRAILVRFFCKDEQSILFSLNPWYKWISPQETATVRLTLITKSGSYEDTITFTAQGNDIVEKKVLVTVGSNIKTDRDGPEINYRYTSDCTNVVFGNCQDGTWTIEIKVKDTSSGLLHLTTIPKGIYFPNGFTSGTTEQVTGYLSQSCCNPDLQIIAIDRQNNRNTLNLNAYQANLGPGAIAAIVLGVLLLILIIIALIFLIRCCLARRKETYNLPTYRGPTSSSGAQRF